MTRSEALKEFDARERKSLETTQGLGENERVVVLLSGGLDSSTVVAELITEGVEVLALGIDYGQRHRLELERARSISEYYGVPLDVLDVSGFLGASSLLSDGSVPKGRAIEEILEQGVPSTFVPMRNALFISMASAYAASRGVRRVALGVNKDDYTGYLDCRPAFIKAMQLALDAGLPEGSRVELVTPLVDMDKVAIVKRAISLSVPIEITLSCYSPIENNACLQCDACVLRERAISMA